MTCHRSALFGTVVTAVVIGTTSCASAPDPALAPSSPPALTLGPRPQILRLDNVNPCVLLTAGDEGRLRVKTGQESQSPNGGPACDWLSSSRNPDDAWGSTINLTTDAASALQGDGATQKRIAGFPAVETSSALGGREWSCILLVDVAPGQSLSVSYNNNRQDRPGISHAVACQQATVAAEMMVANLRDQTR